MLDAAAVPDENKPPFVGDGIRAQIAKQNAYVYKRLERDDIQQMTEAALERNDWLTANLLKHLLVLFD